MQGSSPAQAQWMQSLFRQNRPIFSYSVGVNTPEGYLTVGNGNQSAANLALLPAIAVPGMLAAIAIPNFVKARATAQQNACINNLRQLDAVKQQWALEKNKTATDVPTQEDLMPFLRKWPVCPQGALTPSMPSANRRNAVFPTTGCHKISNYSAIICRLRTVFNSSLAMRRRLN